MKKELAKLSLEELKKKRKTLELITGILTGLVIVMFIVGIWEYYDSRVFKLEQLLPLFLAILLVLNYMKIKRIKTEIQTRK